MATALAVEAETTSLAQASALSETPTAQAISQSAAEAASTAQANNNANATATAVKAALDAASQQTRQAQVTPTPAALSVVFEDHFYQGIDIWAAAREQFGPKAVLYSSCDGLSCWYVQSGAQVRPLDLKRAVAKQFGDDWTLVAVGAGRSDWRAVRFADLGYAVLPVMMVPSDRLSDPEGVNTGLARFRTVLANSQYWYYTQVGKTFRLLQLIIVTTEHTSSQWNDPIGTHPNKEELAQIAWSQYARHLPAPGTTLRVVAAPYTGENYTISEGASPIPGFAVAPAIATSLSCPQSGQLDESCRNASYLVGQALGLSFGLDHSCTAYPQDPLCRASILQEGKPPDPILLQPEIEKLKQSPFFTRH
jgi:hypothetical protein